MNNPGESEMLAVCQKAARHFGRGQDSDRRQKEILAFSESGETLEGFQISFHFFFFFLIRLGLNPGFWSSVRPVDKDLHRNLACSCCFHLTMCRWHASAISLTFSGLD